MTVGIVAVPVVLFMSGGSPKKIGLKTTLKGAEDIRDKMR